jgi:microcystin-dependent protein
MPAHSHTIQTYNEKKSYAAVEAYSNHWKNEKTALTGEQGSSLPHNNMQPSLVLNYIIKY